MTARSCIALGLVALAPAALGARASVALAEGVPSHFVSSDECTSRPCTCDDIPIMDAFLQSQKDAKTAWSLVQAEIFTPDGPQSLADTVSSFQSKYMGDPNVAAQFKMCADYDPSVNKLTKVAGVSSSGGAMLDPCFCNAFCQDIVDSTVMHERMHVPTQLLGFGNKLSFFAACKVGALPDRVCNALEPLNLAESELVSHEAGILSLQSDLDDLLASDPSMPEMACTWAPLVPPEMASVVPEVKGFFARVALLVQRIVWGTEPEALAALDVGR